MRYAQYFALILVTLCAGCDLFGDDEPPLIGTRWDFVHLKNFEGTVIYEPSAPGLSSVRFNEDGTVEMWACGESGPLAGKYTLNGDRLEVVRGLYFTDCDSFGYPWTVWKMIPSKTFVKRGKLIARHEDRGSFSTGDYIHQKHKD